MKTCTECKHAEWQRTKNGRLHPSGDGKCAYPWQFPALPGAFYFIRPVSPSGGFINRRVLLHCVYWEKR